MRRDGSLLIMVIVALLLVAIYRKMSPEETPLSPRYHLINELPVCQLWRSHSRRPRISVKRILDSFHACIDPIVDKWRNDTEGINRNWQETQRCDVLLDELDLMPIGDRDHRKWVLTPKCREKNIVVTLGVANDFSVEKTLRRTLPNTEFYAADSAFHSTRATDAEFMEFYPLAIANRPGTMKIANREVVTIPLSYFLADILDLKKIDVIWIDVEGSELEFLDQLHRGEELDKNGISICQINLEIHTKHFPEKAVAFHDFIFRLLSENRYIFLKPQFVEPMVHRMFLLNLEDRECVRKYLE